MITLIFQLLNYYIQHQQRPALFDRPEVLKSDNGPPFDSFDLKKFAIELGFTHCKVTLLWPEANGEAKRFVRTF